MDYIKEALQTKSTSFHPDKVNFEFFCDTLSTAIAALQDLDKIKKALFYGKDFPAGIDWPAPVDAAFGDFPLECLSPDEDTSQGIDVLHAILGIATEAGELLEALVIGVFGDDGFDLVNVAEEIGDVFWYQAILAHSAGKSFEELQATNIAKLRARYPDKFTEYDAQVRDLDAERVILEADTSAEWETSHGPDYTGQCDKAPSGWICSRNKGHDGPCAAIKESSGEMAQRLYATTDAQVWAQEFIKVHIRNGGENIDEGWVISWFANAIETAKSHEAKRLNV